MKKEENPTVKTMGCRVEKIDRSRHMLRFACCENGFFDKQSWHICRPLQHFITSRFVSPAKTFYPTFGAFGGCFYIHHTRSRNRKCANYRRVFFPPPPVPPLLFFTPVINPISFCRRLCQTWASHPATGQPATHTLHVHPSIPELCRWGEILYARPSTCTHVWQRG